MINSGDLSIGQLFTFVLYSVFIGSSVGGMADIYSKLQKAIGSTEHLLDILEEQKEELYIDEQNKGSLIEGNIRFNNLTFFYPSRPDITVIDSLNWTIDKGQFIAVVGPSGAGKTTLASLLFGFYNINQGQLLIDQTDINDYNLHHLRNQIGIVPQDVILFGCSIRDNIAYGKLGSTDEEIERAAKDANALDFIHEFPEKMDTLVGERGIQLSGGQRQRIAIARALLKNPKILIMDEATSALDSESEKLVQQAMNRLMTGRTTIVIAHRLATIKKADCILVLDKGKIVETGTHHELEKKSGLYSHLCQLQFNS